MQPQSCGKQQESPNNLATCGDGEEMREEARFMTVIGKEEYKLLLSFDLGPEIGEEPQKELPSVRTRCPKGSKAYGSHCYALFLSPKSWMDADLACQKRPSGNLVSVLSGAEGSFVSSLVKSISNSYSYVWIGLHDPTQVQVYPPLSRTDITFELHKLTTNATPVIVLQGTEPNGDGWEWSSTDVINYFAWERNPSTISNPGHCAGLSRSTGFLKWKDYTCDARLPYVCKFTD
ncbi:hypothetical protein H8958_002203 [Nasalis larvatus]